MIAEICGRIFHIFKKRKNELIKLQQNISQTHFISEAKCYMFRQEGVIVRELPSNKRS